MHSGSAIIVTGAAGFIGSGLIGFLNSQGYTNIIAVDDFSRADKAPNLTDKQIREKVEREQLFTWLENLSYPIDFIFHLGARTDTTEFDYSVHQRLNVDYSQKVWKYCVQQQVPLVYASSAATYGAGEAGYDDDPEQIHSLKPLNPYGISKNEFDKWVLQQRAHPPFWAGLKFFNVYGPNEDHKGRMASVIFHSFRQIRAFGEVKLFRSHRPDFEDGRQLRDFIYVKDIWSVCLWLMNKQPKSGIYNLGTGKARSFLDLVQATFAAMELPPRIIYIDMPEDIRDTYQYFTEARMQRLRELGYTSPFHSLEEGVTDYVQRYLLPGKRY